MACSLNTRTSEIDIPFFKDTLKYGSYNERHFIFLRQKLQMKKISNYPLFSETH